MLIRFTVSNFLSFRETTEFNMLTGNPRRLEHHVYKPGKGLELIKMAAIYGANGAGKSNLVKAMDYFHELTTSGEWVTPAKRKFRLDAGCAKLPASFEVEFVQDGKPYIYGVDLHDDYVGEEWLYESSLGSEDRIIFHRFTTAERQTRIDMASRFVQQEEDRYRVKFYAENELKDTELFFRKISGPKGPFEEIRQIFDWFRYKWVMIFPHSRPTGLLKGLLDDPQFSLFAKQFIGTLQTGIQELRVEKHGMAEFFGADDKELADKLAEELLKPENKGGLGLYGSQGREELYATLEQGKPVVNLLVTRHPDAQGNLFDFLPREESDGTQRLLDLMPALYKAVREQATVVIDEMEQSIHPVLLKEVVRKFAGDDETKGQLIFTTHEAHLLDQEYMRQDEYWFAEKSPAGTTSLIPLSDFKDIRYDLDLRKGYLVGRFGAVPFTGDLRHYNWDVYAEAANQ